MDARNRVVFTDSLPRHAEEMTEEEACRLALEFVQAQNLSVSGITEVRRIRFNHPGEGLRDLWVVCFATKVPAGRAEYAREVIVEVRNDTGEVTIFGSTQREEI